MVAVLGLVAVPLDAAAEPVGSEGNPVTACTLSGTSGDDFLSGTPDDDVICALEGNDRIDAQSGNDVLLGGPGDDHLNGGDGEDVASYETSVVGVAADVASGTASGEGADALEAVESLTGSASDDVLRGSEAANILSGLGGTDLLFGLEGQDTLLGGDGEDFLAGSGGSLLDGGNENDTCRPGPGPVAVVSCMSTSPEDANDTHGFLDVKHDRRARVEGDNDLPLVGLQDVGSRVRRGVSGHLRRTPARLLRLDPLGGEPSAGHSVSERAQAWVSARLASQPSKRLDPSPA